MSNATHHFLPNPASHALAQQAALRFKHYVTTSSIATGTKTTPPQSSVPAPTIAASAAPSPSLFGQLATLALLKVPISLVFTSLINAALFKIHLGKSMGLELLGIAIEALGTVGVTAAKKYYDAHDTTPDTHTSHEHMLKVAGAGVSLISSVVTISRCVHESGAFFKGLPHLWQVGRVVASVVAGTLCGTLEGHLAGKVTPWLEKTLENGKKDGTPWTKNLRISVVH